MNKFNINSFTSLMEMAINTGARDVCRANEHQYQFHSFYTMLTVTSHDILAACLLM